MTRITNPSSAPDDVAPNRILVVDDDPALRSTLAGLLGAAGFDVLTAIDGERALQIIEREEVDLVLTDLIMTGIDGEELVRRIRHAHPSLAVVVMTSFGSIESAVQLMKSGATEYLTKPLMFDVLLATLRRVLARREPESELVRALRRGDDQRHGLMGASPCMQQLFGQMRRVSPSGAPVLISGETGVGKELVALAVHRASGRAAFVPVNCGAIPAGLLESELFGHVRGAFTGADRDRIGLFEAADGGTLFLDEIAELPLALQAKLLRALQSGEFRRVGDVASRHASVRLIAATHRDLDVAVQSGRFREDLFYRINVLRLDVPPLRDRAADIPLLADQFLADVAARDGGPLKRFSPAALSWLATFDWPGNVRQLRNVVERAAILADDEVLEIDDLPAEIRGATRPTPAVRRMGEEVTLADLERQHVLAVLNRVRGNRSRAARLLGIPRRTLYRRLTDYGLMSNGS